MEDKKNLLIKRTIARICVVIVICTTLFGTLLAFTGKSSPVKIKKQTQHKSILHEPQQLPVITTTGMHNELRAE